MSKLKIQMKITDNGHGSRKTDTNSRATARLAVKSDFSGDLKVREENGRIYA
jgi:hypothetical protein